MAGWSSNNKYSLLGGLRASAQMISYELGMGLAIITILTGNEQHVTERNCRIASEKRLEYHRRRQLVFVAFNADCLSDLFHVRRRRNQSRAV